MYVKKPLEDPRAMILTHVMRSKYNVLGWLLVLIILVLNWMMMSSDYHMMKADALKTSDYKVIGYEVEKKDGLFFIKVDIENPSAEESKPWIIEIQNQEGKTMDLLSAQRYFRFRSADGSINSAVAIPPQARGTIIFTIKEKLLADQEEVQVTFDNLDMTQMKITLTS